MTVLDVEKECIIVLECVAVCDGDFTFVNVREMDNVRELGVDGVREMPRELLFESSCVPVMLADEEISEVAVCDAVAV